MTRAHAISRHELRRFDAQATALILEAVAAGWIGYISNRNHAILYAPDRRGTISISRDSKRGRSGRNADAAYRRWQARQ